MEIQGDKLWSLEAEAGVLGSMIVGPEYIGDILPILDEKSFFKPENQVIYNCLVSLYIVDVPVDAVTLRTELKSLNQLERIGGVDYIRKLMETVPHAVNALYYAKIVKDRQRYRELITTIQKIQNVPNEPLKVDEQIQRIQELSLSLKQAKPTKDYFTFTRDAERIANDEQEQESYISTGLRNIDGIIRGIAPGELIVIAGRPSMGKSALALQFALNMAKAGLSIVFFTLEMTHRALIQRALKQEQLDSITKLDVVLNESANTPEKQIAFIKTRKQGHKIDIVVVDYLQLMSSGGKSENRVQEITNISRKLKLATISENLPIVALSQLNREVESRDKHRPRLSDLRDSGSIEQDADVVFLINREDYYRRNEDPEAPQDGNAEIIIAKNRRGPTGIAGLVFLDEHVKFGDKVYG